MTTRSEITKQKVGIRGEKPERQRAEVGGQKSDPVRFLTRHELAEALKVSVRTVDTMLAGGEIPHLRLHGNFIRFYLPDVVRHLTATALVSKRRWAGPRRNVERGGESVERGAGSVLRDV